MYNFIFDRRSLALLLAGLAAVALLLFAGGMFVGLRLQLDDSAPVAANRFRPLGPAEPASVVGTGTDAGALAKPPPPELPTNQPATAEAPPPELAANGGGGLAERATTGPAPVAAAEPPTDPEATATPLPADGSVPVLSHAELIGSDGEPTFGVQVGAFELRSTASRTATRLAHRGWDTYLVPFDTPSGRQMFSIRFGRFSDRTDAYRAAHDFEERENTPALVRLQSRAR